MKLEEGKRYVTRDGEIKGPIARSGNAVWPWESQGRMWTEQGKYFDNGADYHADLVSEYIEQPELPDAVFYVYRVGDGLPFREHKTQEEAQNEAMRLAGQHPESVFRVLKTIAIVTAPMPVPTITQTK